MFLNQFFRAKSGRSFWMGMLVVVVIALDSSIGLAQSDEAPPLQLESPQRVASTNRQEPSKITPARLQALRENIQLFKKLIDAQEAAENTTTPTPALPVTQTKAPPPSDPIEVPNRVQSKLLELKSTVPDEPSIDEPMSDIPVPEESGIPVLTEPVNSMELANSLFLIGNTTAARQRYEAILNDKRETNPLDANDEVWLKCLIGCCYRREGNFGKSETVFREITGLKKNSYPVNHAKWSLQYVQQRRLARISFHAIENEINDILNKVDHDE